ncbi:MAG: inositol monophosphatase family protein [Gemmatimonadota bacterium]|nr:inositol monophosphatase [Gemmatimonadota bacterium]
MPPHTTEPTEAALDALDAWLTTARDAADAAARVHAHHLGASQTGSVTTKGRSDFVSAVDLEAQAEIEALVRARHPDHALLAEEEGLGHDQDPGEGPLWVIDPLDGTTNFLHGHPFFASSVAVAVAGRVVAGAVTAAATGERWWARQGGGAWYQGPRAPAPVPLRVSTCGELAGALIGTGFPFKRLEALPPYLVQFDRVLRATSGIRRAGAAALDLCFVAAGRLDAFWELHLAPWDIAAGLILLEEAGGVAVRPDGRPLDLRPGAVVAANGRPLLDGLLGLVGGD